MRFDSFGMFWQDEPVSRKRGERQLGPMPEIPYTGWTPPREFPNLSAAKVIGYDTETWDPELLTSGPGWGRGPGKGHIVGVSVAVHGGAWYFPMRHETQPELNLDPDQVLRWLQYVLGDSRPKVGANLVYDLGWLRQEGVRVGGRQYDVQFAEALLNSEEPDVSLEGLSQRYLGYGKQTELLYEWLAAWFGGTPTEKQRKWLAKSPPSLAGPYAEGDAVQPIQILERQWEAMSRRGVVDLFDMECRLIPLLVEMRLKGAPISMDRANHIYDTLGGQAKEVERQLAHLAGFQVNPNAAESVGRALRGAGVDVPLTFDKKKQEHKLSFSASVLEAIDHPIAEKIVEYRKLTKVANTFVKSYIINKQVNGRLHCSFNPLKSDSGGTRSGRFSSSDPNLQNIPVRTAEGKLVRKAFVAAAEGRWRQWDYSQIEYRMLMHHAVGPMADEVRARFINDFMVDYHNIVLELIAGPAGWDISSPELYDKWRRPTKTINFGLIYGMSKKELIKRLKLTNAEGNRVFEAYHGAAPFIRKTMEEASNEARAFGYVQTILGRRSDFKLYGPAQYDPGAQGLPYEQAIMKYGAVELAYTHKALNRKLQGGAADVMKKAMVDCYEAGIFAEDACGIPILTVHDELDFEDMNAPDNPAWAEMRQIMQNCVKLRVPVRIDESVGPSWGEAD